MMKGKVKNLKPEQNFGFIRGEDGQEYFFHRSAVVGDYYDSMEKGSPVEFEGEDTPKGLRAEQVILL